MPPRPGTLRNRWTAYAVLSTALAAGVVLKALAQRPNFYSAAVYLSQSSANLMILCNLVFVSACSFLLFLQQTLYGPLRPVEIEQLYEKSWFAVTETCLAMTIFRGEIGPWFLVMFFSLLVGKVWGWIGEGRIEVLEQQQQNIVGGANARLFHTRLVLSLGLSVIFDLIMLNYIVAQVLHMARPDMMVMFGFEFAVLSVSSASTALRYALNIVEGHIVRSQKQKKIATLRKERVEAALRELESQPQQQANDRSTSEAATSSSEARRRDAEVVAASQPIDESDIEVEGWESKGRYMFYLDLTTDFLKLCVYLSFFIILLVFYGLPLHIMRDVFLTCRSFFKRIGDFVRYRNATRDMHERYPDATEAEIGREDVCIICREEMRPYVPPAPGNPADPVAERMRPKKLPCGHVLHFSCLRSWLERQQICPTCRATVVPPQQNQQATARGPGAAVRHAPNAANGRPRVYQFGPLRIGVGAIRGNNLFEQLDQQLANANPAPPEQQNGNVPQQYGFGIRWGGARRRQQTSQRQPRQVEDHLRAVERQMQREADSLQASMGELQALRSIQAQLARIRMARDATVRPDSRAAANPAILPTQIDMHEQQRATTVLRPNHDHSVLQSGSDQLPTGLTLPEGWTLMPLEAAVGTGSLPPALAPPPFPPIGVPNGHTLNTTGFNMAGPQLSSLQTTLPSNSQPPTNADASQNIQAAQPSGSVAGASTRSDSEAASDSSVAGATSGITFRNNDGEGSIRTSTAGPGVESNISEPSDFQRMSNTTRTQPSATNTTQNDRVNGRARHSSTQPSTLRPTSNSSDTEVTQPARLNASRAHQSHRPSRSIGSSWGFSNIDDGSDEDSGEDSDDIREQQKRIAGTVGDHGSRRPAHQADAEPSTAQTVPRQKGKVATVEESVGDPD